MASRPQRTEAEAAEYRAACAEAITDLRRDAAAIERGEPVRTGGIKLGEAACKKGCATCYLGCAVVKPMLEWWEKELRSLGGDPDALTAGQFLSHGGQTFYGEAGHA